MSFGLMTRWCWATTGCGKAAGAWPAAPASRRSAANFKRRPSGPEERRGQGGVVVGDAPHGGAAGRELQALVEPGDIGSAIAVAAIEEHDEVPTIAERGDDLV